MNDQNQKKDGCQISSNQTKPPRSDNDGSVDSTESLSPGVERQDLCFHIGQSLILGLLAVSTLRMKCFWSPYLCILTSAGISDPTLWTFFLNKVSGGQRGYLMNPVRHLVLITLILYLGNQQTTRMNDELENLREFYDPDTVDLMQWIQQNTGQDDAISGSMQLMAGVKLCTGRTITNHPHFEDKGLRDRTQELYQMYGKESPDYVHQLLIKYNTSYIILEDSICLSHRGRCSTPDIMDLVNNHIPEDGIQDPPYLEESDYPRFCDEVRYDSPEYRKLFKPVFENKTFRIYKLHR
ncbi:probable C-mannosyltransferase DPY19L3 [Eurytemora carolleeae]|uniref:probable C-mannosyltransferase DPY19L3 n=1 Tax=Eurytemora carolleeae TaxID=1294199 RepID=UPI000C763004|nr:probable C-mannosyltransferase DPY19L3 [Eurytemora carolleeae]|eukprot:XP_023340285.1 probable C-mannosyltransferase DPY19L3 [Eurytemora affinis]